MIDSPRSPAPQAANLSALLEDAPYIDDAAFSDRVARALPPKRRAKRFSYAVIPAFAALACVLAFALSGPVPVSLAAHTAHPVSLLAAMGPFLALALALLLVASASLIAADE